MILTLRSQVRSTSRSPQISSNAGCFDRRSEGIKMKMIHGLFLTCGLIMSVALANRAQQAPQKLLDFPDEKLTKLADDTAAKIVLVATATTSDQGREAAVMAELES